MTNITDPNPEGYISQAFWLLSTARRPPHATDRGGHGSQDAPLLKYG